MLANGVWMRTAMMLPGDAGARRPLWKATLVATPVMPPAMAARTSIGFISTYGK